MRKSGMRHLDIRITEGGGDLWIVLILWIRRLFSTSSHCSLFFSISFRFYEREYGHRLHGCV